MKQKYFPIKRDFLNLARTKRIIPVFTKFSNLQDNPTIIYKKLNFKKNSFLLDSGDSSGKTAHWAFIGANPFIIVKSRERKTEIIFNPENQIKKKREIIFGDPLCVLQEFFSKFKMKLSYKLPPFFGGAVGFFSYDLVHLFETLPKTTIDDVKHFDLYFIFVKAVIALDYRKKEIWLITNVETNRKNLEKVYDEAIKTLNGLRGKIVRGNVEKKYQKDCIEIGSLRSNYTLSEYKKMVRRAKEYIKNGDIYQANLSQRFKARVKRLKPFFLYERLRKINPSPFACFLDFPEVQIISSSPERLIRVADNMIETRPIAGTRPRGKTRIDDAKMEKELILNDKERAEHIMLVDLERNDLGRVCRYGTVNVDELMVLEKYSHVIHIVSNVRGHLQKGRDGFDCIRACFPGGTITGVPKVRCMEIIDELEKHRRGPYTGSAGYICFDGNMDLNILIRTFVFKENNLYFQVGGGIVADSVPEKEYEETLHKAEALMEAIGVSKKSLIGN